MEIDGYEIEGKEYEKEKPGPSLDKASDAVTQAYNSLAEGSKDPGYSSSSTSVSTTLRLSQRGLGFYAHGADGVSLKNFYVGPARVIRIIGDFAYGMINQFGFEYHVMDGVAFRIAPDDTRLMLPHTDYDADRCYYTYYEADDDLASTKQADFFISLCDPKVGTGDLQKLFKAFNPDLDDELAANGNKLCRSLNDRGLYLTVKPVSLSRLLNWY